MGARHRTKRQDERDERSASGDRVCEERDGDVAPARRSAMMPEPTTAASSMAVPSASATQARIASCCEVIPSHRATSATTPDGRQPLEIARATGHIRIQALE